MITVRELSSSARAHPRCSRRAASRSASSRPWALFTPATSRSCGWPEASRASWSSRSSSIRSSSRRARTSSVTPGARTKTRRCSTGKAPTSSTCPTPREFYSAGFLDDDRGRRRVRGGRRSGPARATSAASRRWSESSFSRSPPTSPVFGRKDLQQVAVIRRMTRDLDFPVRLVIGETVREPDGLALSSRNAYLSPAERQRAALFPEALFAARDRVRAGERDASGSNGRDAPGPRDAGFSIDYVDVLEWETHETSDADRGGHGAGGRDPSREDSFDRQRFYFSRR